MLTSIEDAAAGLKLILMQNQGVINAELSLVGVSNSLTIFDHYDENINNDQYPLLMIQEIDQQTKWYGLSNISYWEFSFNVFGLIQHDDPYTIVKQRRRFAAGVSDVLASNFRDFQVNGRWLQFLDGVSPMKSISYDVNGPSEGNVLIRGFVARWNVQAVQSVSMSPVRIEG